MNKLMTFRPILRFSAASTPVAALRHVLFFALFLPLVTACGTTTIEEAVPQAALEESASATQSETETQPEILTESTGEPDNTGEYPNLNDVQRGALKQMTEAEKREYLATLQEARAGQTAAGNRSGRSVSQRELKRIARTHDNEALEKIENAEDNDEGDEQ